MLSKVQTNIVYLSVLSNTIQCDDIPFRARAVFFPRECCSSHKAYDKRTPVLFKIEAEGNAMIGLRSKTYILNSYNKRNQGRSLLCRRI